METYRNSLSYYSQKYYGVPPSKLNIIDRFLIDNTLNYKPSELTAEEFDTLDPYTASGLILKRCRKKYVKNVLFITVNPPDGSITPAKLVSLAKTICSYKNVKEYSFCIETRGEQPETKYHGMHLHMILVCDQVLNKIGKIRANAVKRFKNIRGINDLAINVKTTTLSDHTNLYNYIRGYKKGKEKSNHDFDLKFRELHGLDNLYE